MNRTIYFVLVLSTTLNASLSARQWSDVTGKFKVEAELVSVTKTAVVLRHNSGKTITVPLSKLSQADRDFLNARDIKPAPKNQPILKKDSGPQLGQEFKYRYKIGINITANGGDCQGLIAAVPVPMDWPEQTVNITDEKKTSHVRRVSYRTLNDGAKQMVISIPILRRGESAEATAVFETNRRISTPPTDTTIYRKATRLSRDLRHYLQPSPFIQSDDREIKALANEFGKSDGPAWAEVKEIYDWVQTNIPYKGHDLKGALKVLHDRNGDCEGRSQLFVALCRNRNIPARLVWVPAHVYPEFYLEDDYGNGNWFPCQSAGDNQIFGGIDDGRIILQKGDNFKIPEERAAKQYAAEVLSAKNLAGGPPTFKSIREQLETNKL